MPALYTLIYVGGLAFVTLLLLIGLLRTRKRPAAVMVGLEELPKEVRKRMGSTSTNRGLRALRWLFILLALGVFGFHIYWARYAPEQNEKFQELSYKDLRVRRLSESTLRGWILDRSGRLDQPLAYYKRDPNGDIHREYPMDKAFAHIFGSDRGDPGLERALFGVQSGALPEALDVVRGRTVQFKGNQDVRLTIDRYLQQTAVDLMKGKHGAVVIVNPQTGEVLALVSLPSYNNNLFAGGISNEEYQQLLEQPGRPLIDHAISDQYPPGSTYKLVTGTGGLGDGKLIETSTLVTKS